MTRVVNVVAIGHAGQGVVRVADLLADAAFRAGHDVKRTETEAPHGGPVVAAVRFGEKVLSPLVSRGDADHVVVLAAGEVEPARSFLCAGGELIGPADVPAGALADPRWLGVALLGALSTHLGLPADAWAAALRASLPAEERAAREAAFREGERLGLQRGGEAAGGGTP
jgi:indolepyruvate ferredoxin oxidoreductase beta subunit